MRAVRLFSIIVVALAATMVLIAVTPAIYARLAAKRAPAQMSSLEYVQQQCPNVSATDTECWMNALLSRNAQVAASRH